MLFSKFQWAPTRVGSDFSVFQTTESALSGPDGKGRVFKGQTFGWLNFEMMRSSLVRMRSSLVRMRSRLVRMRSSLVVRASDCQCTSCNGPGFDPSIRRHSGIWGAADEAVLNIIQTKRKKIPPPKKKTLRKAYKANFPKCHDSVEIQDTKDWHLAAATRKFSHLVSDPMPLMKLLNTNKMCVKCPL